MTGTLPYYLHYSISINLYVYIKITRFATVFIKIRKKNLSTIFDRTNNI